MKIDVSLQDLSNTDPKTTPFTSKFKNLTYGKTFT